MPISAAVSQMLLEQTGELNRRAARLGYSPPRIELPRSSGCDTVFQGNGQVNVRVNQDCSLRQQPGTAVAVDPLDPGRVLVGAERLPEWVQPLRRRLELGRRPDVGRPDAAVLAVHADGRQDRGRLRRPERGLGRAGELGTWAATLNMSAPTPRRTRSSSSKSNAGIGGAFFHSPTCTGASRSTGRCRWASRRISTTRTSRSTSR